MLLKTRIFVYTYLAFISKCAERQVHPSGHVKSECTLSAPGLVGQDRKRRGVLPALSSRAFHDPANSRICRCAGLAVPRRIPLNNVALSEYSCVIMTSTIIRRRRVQARLAKSKKYILNINLINKNKLFISIWPLPFLKYYKRLLRQKRVGHACICPRMVTA